MRFKLNQAMIYYWILYVPCQLGVPHCVCIKVFALGRIRARPKSFIFALSSLDIYIMMNVK